MLLTALEPAVAGRRGGPNGQSRTRARASRRIKITRPTADAAPAIADMLFPVWRKTYAPLVSPQAMANIEASQPRVIQQIAAQSQNASLAVFVAKRGRRVLGHVVGGRPRWTATTTGFDGEIYNLHVDIETQGLGMGAKLLRSAAGWMHERNYQSLVIRVLTGNTAARGFYEHMGGTLFPGEEPLQAGGETQPGVRYGWTTLAPLLKR